MRPIDQRQQAGLSRPGAVANPQLRSALAPYRRTSSISSTIEGGPPSPTHGSKESLAELWSEFLEREAETGSTTVGGSRATSRRGSITGSSHKGTPRFEAGSSYFRSSPQPQSMPVTSSGVSEKGALGGGETPPLPSIIGTNGQRDLPTIASQDP